MSFVMLTESQVGPPQATSDTQGVGSPKGKQPFGTPNQDNDGEELPFADQVERNNRIFEYISAHSDIDHPICTECTDLVMSGLQKSLLNATRERDAYISFLRTLNSSTVPTTEEIEAAEKSLKETKEAEEKAFAELVALEEEKETLDKEIAELEEQSQNLDLQEEEFWRGRNEFTLELNGFQQERDALNMKYDHDSRQLERLQRTNVYNDAFCIGHDGYFGTINGLRLGRLTNPSVDWPEINAAWGQTALLLATIAEKLGFSFQGYHLRPLGAMSRIDKIEYPRPSPAQSAIGGGNPTALGPPKITTLDLFSSGDLPLNLPWLHRRFDAGMVAFLDCLRQLGEYVEISQTPGSSNRRAPSSPPSTILKLPYPIRRDKIGDASIKLGFNQNDETWTRACKYTLTCCKYLLAHASNVANVGSNSSAAATAGEQARPTTSSPAKK